MYGHYLQNGFLEIDSVNAGVRTKPWACSNNTVFDFRMSSPERAIEINEKII